MDRFPRREDVDHISMDHSREGSNESDESSDRAGYHSSSPSRLLYNFDDELLIIVAVSKEVEITTLAQRVY